MSDFMHFLLGGAVMFVGGLIYLQIKMYFDEKKSKAKHQSDLNKSTRFDVGIMQGQIQLIFERLEKLENKKR